MASLISALLLACAVVQWCWLRGVSAVSVPSEYQPSSARIQYDTIALPSPTCAHLELRWGNGSATQGAWTAVLNPGGVLLVTDSSSYLVCQTVLEMLRKPAQLPNLAPVQYRAIAFRPGVDSLLDLQAAYRDGVGVPVYTGRHVSAAELHTQIWPAPAQSAFSTSTAACMMHASGLVQCLPSEDTQALPTLLKLGTSELALGTAAPLLQHSEAAVQHIATGDRSVAVVLASGVALLQGPSAYAVPIPGTGWNIVPLSMGPLRRFYPIDDGSGIAWAQDNQLHHFRRESGAIISSLVASRVQVVSADALVISSLLCYARAGGTVHTYGTADQSLQTIQANATHVACARWNELSSDVCWIDRARHLLCNRGPSYNISAMHAQAHNAADVVIGGLSVVFLRTDGTVCSLSLASTFDRIECADRLQQGATVALRGGMVATATDSGGASIAVSDFWHARDKLCSLTDPCPGPSWPGYSLSTIPQVITQDIAAGAIAWLSHQSGSSDQPAGVAVYAPLGDLLGLCMEAGSTTTPVRTAVCMPNKQPCSSPQQNTTAMLAAWQVRPATPDVRIVLTADRAWLYRPSAARAVVVWPYQVYPGDPMDDFTTVQFDGPLMWSDAPSVVNMPPNLLQSLPDVDNTGTTVLYSASSAYAQLRVGQLEDFAPLQARVPTHASCAADASAAIACSEGVCVLGNSGNLCCTVGASWSLAGYHNISASSPAWWPDSAALPSAQLSSNVHSAAFSRAASVTDPARALCAAMDAGGVQCVGSLPGTLQSRAWQAVPGMTGLDVDELFGGSRFMLARLRNGSVSVWGELPGRHAAGQPARLLWAPATSTCTAAPAWACCVCNSTGSVLCWGEVPDYLLGTAHPADSLTLQLHQPQFVVSLSASPFGLLTVDISEAVWYAGELGRYFAVGLAVDTPARISTPAAAPGSALRSIESRVARLAPNVSWLHHHRASSSVAWAPFASAQPAALAADDSLWCFAESFALEQPGADLPTARAWSVRCRSAGLADLLAVSTVVQTPQGPQLLVKPVRDNPSWVGVQAESLAMVGTHRFYDEAWEAQAYLHVAGRSVCLHVQLPSAQLALQACWMLPIAVSMLRLQTPTYPGPEQALVSLRCPAGVLCMPVDPAGAPRAQCESAGPHYASCTAWSVQLGTAGVTLASYQAIVAASASEPLVELNGTWTTHAALPALQGELVQTAVHQSYVCALEGMSNASTVLHCWVAQASPGTSAALLPVVHHAPGGHALTLGAAGIVCTVLRDSGSCWNLTAGGALQQSVQARGLLRLLPRPGSLCRQAQNLTLSCSAWDHMPNHSADLGPTLHSRHWMPPMIRAGQLRPAFPLCAHTAAGLLTGAQANDCTLYANLSIITNTTLPHGWPQVSAWLFSAAARGDAMAHIEPWLEHSAGDMRSLVHLNLSEIMANVSISSAAGLGVHVLLNDSDRACACGTDSPPFLCQERAADNLPACEQLTVNASAVLLASMSRGLMQYTAALQAGVVLPGVLPSSLPARMAQSVAVLGTPISHIQAWDVATQDAVQVRYTHAKGCSLCGSASQCAQQPIVHELLTLPVSMPSPITIILPVLSQAQLCAVRRVLVLDEAGFSECSDLSTTRAASADDDPNQLWSMIHCTVQPGWGQATLQILGDRATPLYLAHFRIQWLPEITAVAQPDPSLLAHLPTARNSTLWLSGAFYHGALATRCSLNNTRVGIHWDGQALVGAQLARHNATHAALTLPGGAGQGWRMAAATVCGMPALLADTLPALSYQPASVSSVSASLRTTGDSALYLVQLVGRGFGTVPELSGVFSMTLGGQPCVNLRVLSDTWATCELHATLPDVTAVTLHSGAGMTSGVVTPSVDAECSGAVLCGVGLPATRNISIRAQGSTWMQTANSSSSDVPTLLLSGLQGGALSELQLQMAVRAAGSPELQPEDDAFAVPTACSLALCDASAGIELRTAAVVLSSPSVFTLHAHVVGSSYTRVQTSATLRCVRDRSQLTLPVLIDAAPAQLALSATWQSAEHLHCSRRPGNFTLQAPPSQPVGQALRIGVASAAGAACEPGSARPDQTVASTGLTCTASVAAVLRNPSTLRVPQLTHARFEASTSSEWLDMSVMQVIAVPGSQFFMQLACAVPYTDLQPLTIVVEVPPCLRGQVVHPVTLACAWCSAGTWAPWTAPTDSPQHQCLACPAGAACRGSDAMPVSEDGWWLASAGSVLSQPCALNSACQAAQRDSRENATWRASCSAAHSGRLCKSCAAGYGKAAGQCIACPSLGPLFTWLVFGLLIMLAGLVLFIGTLPRARRAPPARQVVQAALASAQTAAVQKIVLAHLQQLVLISQIDARLPEPLNSLLVSLGSLGTPVDNELVPWECTLAASGGTPFVAGHVVSLLLPLAAFAAVNSVWAVAECAAGARRGARDAAQAPTYKARVCWCTARAHAQLKYEHTAFARRWALSAAVLIGLVLPTLTMRAASLWACQTILDERYVEREPSWPNVTSATYSGGVWHVQESQSWTASALAIPCGDPTLAAGLGVPYALYLVVLPAVLFWMLWRGKASQHAGAMLSSERSPGGASQPSSQASAQAAGASAGTPRRRARASMVALAQSRGVPQRQADYAMAVVQEFMCESYKPEAWWADAAFLLRRMVMMLATVLLQPAGLHVQLVVVLLILVAAAVLHVHFEPFKHVALQRMESASLVLLIITFVSGQLYFAGVVAPAVREAVALLLTLLNIGFLGVAAVFILRRVSTHTRQLRWLVKSTSTRVVHRIRQRLTSKSQSHEVQPSTELAAVQGWHANPLTSMDRPA